MSNTVELYLKLRETVSGGIQKVAATTRSAFGGIDKVIAGTQAKMNDLGKGVKLNVDSSGIVNAQRDIDRLKGSMNDVGRMSGGNSGGGFWKSSGAMMVGGLAARGVEMAARKAYEIGKEGLGVGMEMEKNIVGLSTFVGEKSARSIVERVVREGVLTPYTTQQLLPIERGLIPQGLTPDRAHRDTWALANAVAATGGSDFALERMGWHMQQGAGRGVIDGRIMREFSTAGIPITKLLQDSIPQLKGLSMEKAMDKLDGMTIKYDMVANALYKASQAGGMFEGAMTKLSQTIAGKWSTVLDKMQIAGWKLTESQSVNIKKLEDRMIGFADKLPEIAASMAGDFDKLFARFDKIEPLLAQVGKGLWDDLIKPLKDFALSDALVSLDSSILKLAADILNTPGLKSLGNLAGDVAQGAAIVVGRKIDEARNFWNFFANHDKYERDNDPHIMTDERKGYMWGTAPLGSKEAGLKVDSTAMKHVTDSLGATNFFGDTKAIEDWDKYMQKYYPKTAFSVQTLPLPVKADDKNANGNGPIAEMSESIVGGGRKQIIIKDFKFSEHFTVMAENMADGVTKTKEAYVRMFLEVLQSANAAM